MTGPIRVFTTRERAVRKVEETFDVPEAAAIYIVELAESIYAERIRKTPAGALRTAYQTWLRHGAPFGGGVER